MPRPGTRCSWTCRGELIEKLGLFTVQTKCAEKNQFLTRPDLGRQLSEEGAGP